ncbi:MAG: 5'-nucleotidase C-terminal domain-containing protein [Acidimicrobiales bacterium]
MRKPFMAAVVALMLGPLLAFAPGSGAVELEPQATSFTDVVPGSWYEDAVAWAEDADVTTGTSPTTFSPDDTLDRKQGLTLLWRALGSPTGSPDSGFSDVPTGVYWEEAVNYAKAAGITTGVSATEFGPDLPMTRAMYATMLWRAAGAPTGNPDSGFGDVATARYFTEAIRWLKAEGLTTGIAPGVFGPDETITRAMGVTFLWRRVGSPVFSMNIFHINDHHSHLQAGSIDLAVGDAGDEVAIELGGFPRVVSAIDQLRSANEGENNVTVHAGDAITGTLFYTLFEGEADAALMNEVCFDVFALGNHEFDGGDAGLVTFLDFLAADPDCETDVVAANVVPEIGTPLRPDAATEYFQPYSVQQFGDEQVAFVGIDIAQKTQVSSQPLDTTVFLDEVETAQATIDELSGMGFDKIGLVTHYGFTNDLDLTTMVDGVDFIVGGDSHTLLGNMPALGLEGNPDYPTMATDMGGNTTCIVQAWEYAQVVGEFNIAFDADGNVTSCGGTPHLLLGAVDDFDADENTVSPSQAQVDAALSAAGLLTFLPDAAAQGVLDDFAEEVDVLAMEVIGSSTEDLCLARFPYQDEGVGEFQNSGRSTLCTPDELPNGGHISQQVTDAFLDRAFRADIALQNSGGVRNDIPAGDITIADAYELLPFANTLYELEMTGAEVVLALEQGLGNVIDAEGSSGAYPYGSGIRWNVDVSADFGERFTDIEVRPKGTATWTAIDLDATYVVVANSFMATGGDGYQVMADVVNDGRSVDTFLDYAQSWIDWLIDESPVARPTEYSTQSYTPIPVP